MFNVWVLKEYGFKINEEKTILMKITRKKSAETKIKFGGPHYKQVEEIVYFII